MPLLALPILAQALTVGAGDRTEVRALFDAQGTDLVLESRAAVAADLRLRNGQIGVGYSPALIIAPLESPDREVVILHSFFAGASASWTRRRTSYRLSLNGTVSRRNFLLEALSAPQPGALRPEPDAEPGAGPDGEPTPEPVDPDATPSPDDSPGAPGSPSDGDARATGNSVWFGGARSEAALSHRVTRITTFSSSIGYEVRGGLQAEAREDYPLLYGPDAQLGVGVLLSRQDELVSSVGALYARSLDGDRIWSAWERERWIHSFSEHTRSTLGVGAAVTWEDEVDEPPTTGIYPTAMASLSHETAYRHGWLTSLVALSYAPALDPVAVRLDPRFAITGQLGWVRQRWSLSATSDTSISLDPEAPGGLIATGASLTAGYFLGAGFTAESGARGAYQQFEGSETIPVTGALFVALSWSAAHTL